MQLNAAYAAHHFRPEEFNYQPTLLNDAGLLSRLLIEIRFLLTSLKNSWPAFRQDPVAVAKRIAVELLQRRANQRRLATTTVALLVVSCAVLFVLIKGGRANGDRLTVKNPDESAAVILNLLTHSAPSHTDNGIGDGSLGRLGFSHGRGEGSNQEPRKAQGGGSGGNKQKLPVSNGSIPPPSQIPAPIPTAEVRKNPSLPAAGIDLDRALWKALAAPVYGDPRAMATTPSNGSGDGGGIGTEQGQGIGNGRGNGFGYGWDGNMGGDERANGSGERGGGTGNNPNGRDPVLRASMVSQRARVLSKPEPKYTEEARRNQISGTVVLRAVFSKTGAVTNIRAISSLPFGLTERAISAARQIRFLPATKDNLPVSVHMQLEYNFNLY